MATTTPVTSAVPLAFTRPSRHDGPDHVIRVDAVTLRPLSCVCAAGRRGLLCWAVIDVVARDLDRAAYDRWAAACGMDEIAVAARVLTQVRKWRKAARELQALRPSDYRLTDRGRAAIA